MPIGKGHDTPSNKSATSASTSPARRSRAANHLAYSLARCSVTASHSFAFLRPLARLNAGRQSRRRSTSVAFGAKRKLTKPRLQSGFMSTRR